MLLLLSVFQRRTDAGEVLEGPSVAGFLLLQLLADVLRLFCSAS